MGFVSLLAWNPDDATGDDLLPIAHTRVQARSQEGARGRRPREIMLAPTPWAELTLGENENNTESRSSKEYTVEPD